MKRAFSLIGWLLLAPPVLASGVEFEARLWSPDLGGVALVNDGGAGTAIDLASDLGFGNEQTLEGRLTWRPTKRTSLRLEYSSFEFAGDSRLNRSVAFAGTTFDLDARVSSLLELESGRVGLAWQFLATGDGRARFGPVVEARGFRGTAGISTDILGLLPLSVSEEFEVAFAAAGLVLEAEPSRKLHLYAGWTTTVSSGEGDLTDVDAGLRYHPLEALGLTVGYRRLELEVADGNEMFAVELDGPYFGAVLRF